MDKQWKIRLLDGVLSGREIWFRDSQLSLGEQQCDVCLPLAHNQRVQFTAREAGLFIDAGTATVRVNGRKHLCERALPLTGVLQVAGLTMAFGPVDTSLADYTLPPRSAKIAMMAGGLLLLGCGLLVTMLSPDRVPPPPDSAYEQVNQLLSLSLLKDQIQAHLNRDGSITLTGYCQQESQMQSLRMKLEASEILFSDQVICADQLARNVQDVLLQVGYDRVQVINESPGSVLIRADISMGKRWADLQPVLSKLPGLRHWRVENPYQSQAKVIIDTLVKQGLGNDVSVTPVGQAFVISGVLNAQEKNTLDQTLTTLKAQYPNVMLSYQNVPASQEAGKRLPSPIAGMINGRHGRYLILEDGERLHVGSQLPDGSKVVALTANGLALTYQNSLIHYTFSF